MINLPLGTGTINGENKNDLIGVEEDIDKIDCCDENILSFPLLDKEEIKIMIEADEVLFY